jgi:hypothetical protein
METQHEQILDAELEQEQILLIHIGNTADIFIELTPDEREPE